MESLSPGLGSVIALYYRVGERNYEKCGYLTKLGGKFKSWQKRYFQLKDGNLAYWKSHVSAIF